MNFDDVESILAEEIANEMDQAILSNLLEYVRLKREELKETISKKVVKLQDIETTLALTDI